MLPKSQPSKTLFTLPTMSQETYSVPEQAAGVFKTGILENPLIAKSLPPEITECAAAIRFEGSETPSIPIIWRFAESISALKALEASMLNVLLVRKYGISPPRVIINTYVKLAKKMAPGSKQY